MEFSNDGILENCAPGSHHAPHVDVDGFRDILRFAYLRVNLRRISWVDQGHESLRRVAKPNCPPQFIATRLLIFANANSCKRIHQSRISEFQYPGILEFWTSGTPEPSMDRLGNVWRFITWIDASFGATPINLANRRRPL